MWGKLLVWRAGGQGLATRGSLANRAHRSDLRTARHTQWFYFRAGNTRAGVAYRFNVVNLLKPDSMFRRGMLPCVHSAADADKGWRRAGSDVLYFRNPPRAANGAAGGGSGSGGGSGATYTLSFRYASAHAGDTLHFAHCYPYTFSDLQRYLAAAQADPARAPLFRRGTLARTLADNPVEVVTVTARGDPAGRRGVVVSARVHPGESNASWMMKVRHAGLLCGAVPRRWKGMV